MFVHDFHSCIHTNSKYAPYTYSTQHSHTWNHNATVAPYVELLLRLLLSYATHPPSNSVCVCAWWKSKTATLEIWLRRCTPSSTAARELAVYKTRFIFEYPVRSSFILYRVKASGAHQKLFIALLKNYIYSSKQIF